MKFRIYPKTTAVLEVFQQRLADALEDFDFELADCLDEEIALIKSHAPEEIAVELED